MERVKPKAQELPPGILAEDLKWDPTAMRAWKMGDHGELTFYQVADRRGRTWWCIATLRIGTGRNYADRTYAITLDGKVVRVGKGPHVKQTLTVYVRESRLEALKKYTDLYTQGAGDAGMIRDRISSRRAQGQMERAAGHRSWTWEV